jgi:hypothetical protein
LIDIDFRIHHFSTGQIGIGQICAGEIGLAEISMG